MTLSDHILPQNKHWLVAITYPCAPAIDRGFYGRETVGPELSTKGIEIVANYQKEPGLLFCTFHTGALEKERGGVAG